MSEEISTFDNQYYPTPRSLGTRMFQKFKNKDFRRFLDPEAGRGDLVDVVKDALTTRHSDPPTIECVEIDLANQAILRAKGYRVVGTDFLKYRGASVYSHILMNPPFRAGVKHLLHAWELMFTGEIICVLPAATVKYPINAERKLLGRLIAEHGSVEYLTEAFMSEDTKRTTRVDIALIHLVKVSTEYASFIDGLRKEVEKRQAPGPESFTEVIVPRDFIENMVINFECAVEAAKQACIAQRRADHYTARFNGTIAEERRPTGGFLDPHVVYISKSFNQTYDELKGRAWSTVLRSSSVLDKLSSAAQKRVEAEFKNICSLEFTYENIWGFFDGIVAQQAQIQADMICDVFDIISRFHSENRAYYQGWKSNDKHRLNAFRIKTTRFILPSAGSHWSWSTSFCWDNEQRLRDFDKVFAMLDSKRPEDTSGLVKLCKTRWDDLRAGERLSSDYFDLRYYPRAGTYHFFPRRKDLIDRMNQIVGEKRKWLPHEKSAAPDAFWKQYEAAEKITSRMPNIDRHEWHAFRGSSDDEESDYSTVQARAKMLEAHNDAMASFGMKYDPSMLLEHEEELRLAVPQLENKAA
jgi:hypothetical protein